MAGDTNSRFNALIRKANAAGTVDGNNEHVGELLALLGQRIKTKKDYESVLGEAEAAEAWCKAQKLTEEQEKIVMAMQAQKDIFVPNPLLDHALTAFFLFQIALVGWGMHARGLTWFFLLLLVIIDALIRRVKGLSEELGKRLSSELFRLRAVDSSPLSGKVQMKKWTEQSWQLFIHVVASIAELVILTEETWWDDPSTCWVPHPFEQRGKARADLQVLYMAQLAVWVYTCFIHRFVDERRKDYFVMYLHHVVTISLVGMCCLVHHLLASTRAGMASPLLVGVSWGNGYLRVGLLVLYVHDVSDIFVDLLKMSNYLKVEGAKGWYITELAYASCVCSWVYYRLYQFPFRAIYASFVEPLKLLTKHPRVSVTVMGLEWLPPDLPLYTEMNALLFLLLVLHIYWFHLFLMIGYRIINEGTREASRQEYEGDSDEEEVSEKATAPAPALAPALAPAAAQKRGSKRH